MLDDEIVNIKRLFYDNVKIKNIEENKNVIEFDQKIQKLNDYVQLNKKQIEENEKLIINKSKEYFKKINNIINSMTKYDLENKDYNLRLINMKDNITDNTRNINKNKNKIDMI